MSPIRKLTLPLLSAIGLFAASQSHALTIVTPSGSMSDGGDVSATAVFSLVGDVLTIQLSNLEQNPTSAGQLISGLEFNVSSGGSATLNSAMGVTASIDANTGAYSPSSGAQSLPKWEVTGGSGSYVLDAFKFVLPTPEAPYDMIIGPDNQGGFSGAGLYSNANSSITNPNHSPDVLGTGTFSVTVDGLSSLSQISGVTFEFGTGPDTFIPGVPGTRMAPTPEPTTIISGALMLVPLSVQFIRKMRERKQEA